MGAQVARDYLQEKWDKSQSICDVNDMMPMRAGQTKLENEKLSSANHYLFCDTNLMVTRYSPRCTTIMILAQCSGDRA
jgi:nicotinamide riboside kinase